MHGLNYIRKVRISSRGFAGFHDIVGTGVHGSWLPEPQVQSMGSKHGRFHVRFSLGPLSVTRLTTSCIKALHRCLHTDVSTAKWCRDWYMGISVNNAARSPGLFVLLELSVLKSLQ